MRVVVVRGVLLWWWCALVGVEVSCGGVVFCVVGCIRVGQCLAGGRHLHAPEEYIVSLSSGVADLDGPMRCARAARSMARCAALWPSSEHARGASPPLTPLHWARAAMGKLKI